MNDDIRRELCVKCNSYNPRCTIVKQRNEISSANLAGLCPLTILREKLFQKLLVISILTDLPTHFDNGSCRGSALDGRSFRKIKI
jgi:hypothetical protein